MMICKNCGFTNYAPQFIPLFRELSSSATSSYGENPTDLGTSSFWVCIQCDVPHYRNGCLVRPGVKTSWGRMHMTDRDLERLAKKLGATCSISFAIAARDRIRAMGENTEIFWDRDHGLLKVDLGPEITLECTEIPNPERDG